MVDTTHHEHGDRRDRSIRQTLFASLGQQITVIAVTLISLPFVTRTLTTEEYGVLATLTGFVALLGFADLGIGSAVTTRLAHAWGMDDADQASEIVTTGLVAAIIASGVMLMFATPLGWLLPWSNILGVKNVPDGQLRWAVLSMVLATAIAITGTFGQRVLYGLQRGKEASMWAVGSTVVGGGLSILGASLNASLPYFVLTTAGAPALVGLACTGWVLFRDSRTPVVASRFVALREFRNLAGASGWFFAIALFSAIGFQTDVLVTAAVLGASAAGVFSVSNRLFGLVLQVLFPAMLQLWPAIGEAFARGDLGWIRSRLRWAIGLALVGSATASGLLLLIAGPLIRRWLTPALVPPQGLLLALALWTTLSLMSAPLFMFLNAVGRVRTHALFAIAVGVANLPLSIILTQQIGLPGPALGSVAANVCLATIPGAIVVVGMLRQRPTISAATAPRP